VANYSTQRRRQYTLERNGILALGQLAKQIHDERKFGQQAASSPAVPFPLLARFKILSDATEAAVSRLEQKLSDRCKLQTATPSSSQ